MLEKLDNDFYSLFSKSEGTKLSENKKKISVPNFPSTEETVFFLKDIDFLKH